MDEYKEGLAHAVLFTTTLVLLVLGGIVLGLTHPLWLTGIILLAWASGIIASIVYMVRKKWG